MNEKKVEIQIYDGEELYQTQTHSRPEVIPIEDYCNDIEALFNRASSYSHNPSAEVDDLEKVFEAAEAVRSIAEEKLCHTSFQLEIDTWPGGSFKINAWWRDPIEKGETYRQHSFFYSNEQSGGLRYEVSEGHIDRSGYGGHDFVSNEQIKKEEVPLSPSSR